MDVVTCPYLEWNWASLVGADISVKQSDDYSSLMINLA